MLFHHIANILCITSGLCLFGLGLYGLLDHQSLDAHVLTEMLAPMGYGTWIDKVHLAILGVVGFWLTIGMQTRIPAAVALALVLAKLLLLGEALSLDKLLILSLSLICFAAILQMITHPQEPVEDPDPRERDWLW